MTTISSGYNSINSRFNSNLNNGFTTGIAISTNTQITPVRVKSIILDRKHPRFKELKEWSALGAIEFELVEEPSNTFFLPNDKTLPVAYPLNSNIKNYPLLNELVYILVLPGTEIGTNRYEQKAYYINIGLWNHPHQNAYPTISDLVSPSQNKSYEQTQVGSTNQNSPFQLKLGNTFIEKSNIRSLLPFEGDIIYEGRWGNSIRLGSTVKDNPNNWSKEGTNGDALTIIRNGQGIQPEGGFPPITENINNDESSIYLTSTQNIPLEASSTSYVSYSSDKAPTSPSKYAGSQIILNSGRLVFNTDVDHILLSSIKSINLNSKESVNIDTTNLSVQADKIYLGKNEANEPLMLGIQTANLLKTLVESLTTFMTITSTATTNICVQGAPATLPTINSAAQNVLDDLFNLTKALGSDPGLKDCNLTSKRNFTV